MAKRDVGTSPIQPRSTVTGQAVEQLRREILMRFNAGDPLPSERQLGQLLRVSRKTVRKAIEQLRAEGWVTRPHGAAPRAARPPTRPVHTSGLLFPMGVAKLLHGPFYREVTTGLHEAALAQGRSLLYLFSVVRRRGDLLTTMMGLPNIRLVDSLVTLEVFKESVLAELAHLGPVVALDVDGRAAGVSSICFDHQASTQMAVKYLYDLGHRRIGLLVREIPNPDPAIRARYDGYVQAMQRMGLSVTADLEYQISLDEVTRAADQIVGKPIHRRPTAIVATDNAWPLAYALIRKGVRIPQDISLVSVGVREGWDGAVERIWTLMNPERPATRDDLDRFVCSLPAAMTGLSLTTVELPAREMGKRGMAELLRRLGQPGQECTHQCLPVELRPGNSTSGPSTQGL